jgi:hypothetical protein
VQGHCPVCNGPVQVVEGALVFHVACAAMDQPASEVVDFDWRSAAKQLPVSEQDKQRMHATLSNILRGKE